MTSTYLQRWIAHPEELDRETLYELRTLVARYPYFQSARLLFLKNLYLLHDIAFGAELHKAVTYVADRSSLFYMVEGDEYALKPMVVKTDVLEDGKQEGDADRTLTLIDAFLATVPEEEQTVVAPGLDYTMDYAAYMLQEDSNEDGHEQLSETLPKMRGQDLIDSFIEKSETADGRMTFMPEVKENGIDLDADNEDAAVSILEQSRQDAQTSTADVSASVEETLGKQETVDDDEEEGDASPVSDELDDSCFTETLAKIYIKQHRYEKALEIIKKLSLNYPKKNAYFADQIRFLEKLIINAKLS